MSPSQGEQGRDREAPARPVHERHRTAVSGRDWSDAHLVHAAREIHADDPTFGYRFIADELARERGIRASENRVQRLCSAHGIFSVPSPKRGRRARPGEPVHDDLVRRAFGARAPNELWFTDITEHRTDEGKLCLRGEGRLLVVASSATRCRLG